MSKPPSANFAREMENVVADICHAYGVTRDVVKGLCEELANLKAENAALREENRKAHDMACEDAVERYRLNGDNAALKIERNRYRIALEDIAQASVEWAGDRARRELDREDKP